MDCSLEVGVNELLERMQKQAEFIDELDRERCVLEATLLLYELVGYICGRALPEISYFVFGCDQVKLRSVDLPVPIEHLDEALKSEFLKRKACVEASIPPGLYDELADAVSSRPLRAAYRVDPRYQQRDEFVKLMNRASDLTSDCMLRGAFANAAELLQAARLLAEEDDLVKIIPQAFL